MTTPGLTEAGSWAKACRVEAKTNTRQGQVVFSARQGYDSFIDTSLFSCVCQDESSHFDVDDSQNAAYLGFSGRLGAGKSGGRVEGSLVRGEGNGRASRKEKDGSGELHGVCVNLSVVFVIMNSIRGEQNGPRRERKAQTSETLKRASIERRRGPRSSPCA